MHVLMGLMRRRWIRDLVRPSLYLRRSGLTMLASIPLLQTVRLLTWPAAQMLGARGLVIIPVLVSRLGHLVVEPLVAGALLTQTPRRRRVLLAPSHLTINPAVAERWDERFRVVRSPVLCLMLEGMARNRRVGFDVWSIASDPGRERLYALAARSGALASASFRPTTEDDARRRELLDALGVGSREYVCISYRPRESADTAGAPDFVDISLRSRSVEQIAEVARAVRDAGFVPVLMGGWDQPAMADGAMMIDYPHSTHKSPEADVLLAQGCRAWIGDTSGISALAMCFGRPRLLLDWIPIASAFHHGREVTVVPKVLRDTVTGRPVDLEHVSDPNILLEFRPVNLHRLGISVLSVDERLVSETIHDFLGSLDQDPTAVDEATEQLRASIETATGMPSGANRIAKSYLRHLATLNDRSGFGVAPSVDDRLDPL